MTEGRPAGKGVTDRVGETPAARNATKLRLEPGLHCLDERPRFGITHAAALFGSAPPYRLLDRQSRPKLCAASPSSMRSRSLYGGAMPNSAAACVIPNRGRSS